MVELGRVARRGDESEKDVSRILRRVNVLQVLRL